MPNFSRSVLALHRSQSARGAQQPVGQDEGGLQVHPRAPLGRRRLVPQVGRRHLRRRREPPLPPAALQRVRPHLLRLQVQALREAGKIASCHYTDYCTFDGKFILI